MCSFVALWGGDTCIPNFAAGADDIVCLLIQGGVDWPSPADWQFESAIDKEARI
jgi:hypothetical protein